MTRPHPMYRGLAGRIPDSSHYALIGDEVREDCDDDPSAGTIVAIYLDGMVELSTGDQVPAADLVLMRRAQ